MCVMRSFSALVILSVLSCGQVFGEEETSKNALWSVGAAAGTLGPGLQASFLIYKRLAVRIEGSYLVIDGHTNNLSIKSAGAILDLHPFDSSFRLSGGMRYMNIEAGFDRTVFSPLVFPLANTFHDTVAIRNSAAPYAGIGFDSSHFSGSGYDFKVGLDLGVVYTGGIDVSARDITFPSSPLTIATEKSYLSNRYDFLSWYPVATVSARIAF